LALRLGNLYTAKKFETYKLFQWRLPMTLLLVYVAVLYVRRRRKLPVELRQCGYVRIGHLRAMLTNGFKILRRQEMPVDAFGDSAKAWVLVITSHRWLNRFTCDVPSPECPTGLRLHSMSERLAEAYPENMKCGFLAPFQSVRMCGWDVLVFFDFMALPQIGQNPDGSLIERTEEETQIFTAALPMMGALYTMYPVVVIPEVLPEVHPYSSSGWCYCEFEQALLYNRLSQFSAAYMEELGSSSGASKCQDMLLSGGFDEQAAADFLSDFEANLLEKKFFFEGDRETVRSIVGAKMLLPQLNAAIKDQDATRTVTYLNKLREAKLVAAINQPLDDSGDVVLHIAMRLPSVEIQELLLNFEGVDTDVRNIMGDSPKQFLLFPVSVRRMFTCKK